MFDKDSDGELCWEEFCEAVKTLLQANYIPHSERETLLTDTKSLADLSTVNSTNS